MEEEKVLKAKRAEEDKEGLKIKKIRAKEIDFYN
jgi:hypothetical protein